MLYPSTARKEALQRVVYDNLSPNDCWENKNVRRDVLISEHNVGTTRQVRAYETGKDVWGDVCRGCGEKGHWKSNCKKAQEAKAALTGASVEKPAGMCSVENKENIPAHAARKAQVSNIPNNPYLKKKESVGALHPSFNLPMDERKPAAKRIKPPRKFSRGENKVNFVCLIMNYSGYLCIHETSLTYFSAYH
jgi:hypothetical protein